MELNNVGRKRLLDDPKKARQVVKLLSQGKSQRATAEITGISRETVNRWVNREDIRAWIDEQAEKYIESLPNALELSRNVLEISRHQTKKAITRGEDGEVVAVLSDFIDTKILDLALKETDNLRKAVGITPSHTSSVVIGNLVLGNQQNVLMPNVQGILDKQLCDIMGDSIDAEFVDTGDSKECP